MSVKVNIKEEPLTKIKVNVKDNSSTKVEVNKTAVSMSNEWSQILNKPFSFVDEKQFSTNEGILKFKTISYNDLSNKPTIEGVPVINDKTFSDFGLEEASILDIEKMFS